MLKTPAYAAASAHADHAHLLERPATRLLARFTEQAAIRRLARGLAGELLLVDHQGDIVDPALDPTCSPASPPTSRPNATRTPRSSCAGRPTCLDVSSSERRSAGTCRPARRSFVWWTTPYPGGRGTRSRGSTIAPCVNIT